MTALMPYPSYKQTGVDWLSSVPTHWSLEPLGKHFAARSSTVSDSDYQPLSVTRDGIVPQLENVAKTDNGDNRKLVRAGDFAINSRSDRKGSSGIADRDGSVSVITTVITPREMDPAFVHQLLRSAPFQEEYYRYGSGIVADLWSTRWSAMKDIRLAVPSLEEQSFIATFLDQETAQIDAFIADQEELIGLLTERRAATISHAVTKGLDPTVPMKDSGIEWLGLVPQHWNLPRLAYLARCSSGLGIDLSSLEPSRSQAMPYPVYGGNGVVGYGPSQNIREGNIVIGRVGALCGNVHSILEPSWVSDNALRLTIDPLKLDQGFLRDVISARRLNDLADKTAQPLITGSLVMAQTIPVPPIDEQLSLVKFLGRETAELDATIADAREAITLSKERRAALISAAVTGKIDVREHGAVA